MDQKVWYEDKSAKSISGWIMLLVHLIILGAGLTLVILGIMSSKPDPALIVPGAILLISILLTISGYRIIMPNECIVLVLFGKYIGTCKTEGFLYVIPFARNFNPASADWKGKISLKAHTLDNNKQKVNDLDGNPIEIGVVSIWKVIEPAKSVFNVENYNSFISVQTDAAIRNITRQYPYDLSGNEDNEKSLRASSKEIAEMLKLELQDRVNVAGIEIIDIRISHLAYAAEIAAAMLQRQQAMAVVQARTKIVEGATSMVKMALEQLKKDGIKFDNSESTKLVSNLMTVLCANKDAQPIINTSSD